MKKIRFVLMIFGLVLVLFLILFFIRLFSERQLDDISPGISCSQNLLEKADVYYVIPKFENKSMFEDKEWVGKIISMNKSLRLHGVYHSYNEFEEDRDESYFGEGIIIFEQAFNFTPERFKAPQLALSADNEKMIKELGIRVDRSWNQLFHKVYHCGDTGKFSNKFIDWF